MFCPSCHAEYRPGFTTCAHCEVPLVETLEVETISADDAENTLPVGRSSDSDVARPIRVGEKVYDLMRVFTLDKATEIREYLSQAGFPVLIVPVDADFPDQRAHFEVRVKSSEHADAEAALRELWAKEVEREGTGGAAAGTSVDQCPACGAHVPLEAEECPDCGLYVGAAGSEDDAEAADEDDAEA